MEAVFSIGYVLHLGAEESPLLEDFTQQQAMGSLVLV
jgi:hypothetical protein